VRELVETPADAAAHSALASHVEMAGPEGETGAPPTLVDNVETLANIARIVARGASWFRTEGTDQSPGTIVSTVIGDVQREGVGEVIMGTPLGEVIEEISGGPRPDHRIKAVLAGVSGAVITADMLDAPVSYEGLAAAGSGLGSGGFIVFDERSDAVAIAAGASRFLAVESCGQCVPCKQDGLELSHLLADLCANNGSESDLAEIRKRADTVGERARCSLATQHQVVLGSLLERFPADFEAHLRATAAPVAPVLVAELVGFEGDESVLDERHLAKQPDWTYDAEDSGQTPADRLGEHRVAHDLED
jgi:NADH:ubiquinone oxidoreductase subunit F (NADH-binding)